ncbi:MAG: pyridoxamine 5'-phosphate oxidase family protein [Acidimicrobiales bacterium]|nr:pyridoxamine 5'-phosphate oxidase family protein [Acidimicrobiales bacterium]
MADDPHAIQSLDQLRRVIPDPAQLVIDKTRPTLDIHSRRIIGLSPLVLISTQGADGRADVSPKGDPPGFVLVLDDTSLAIPDRPGNNRADTLVNLLANPAIGLWFCVPGLSETLRVNGRGRLTQDPDLLARLAVRGREPKLAIVVDVEEAFLHCGKALIRSKLWDDDNRIDRTEVPSLARMLADQLALDDAVVAASEEYLAEDYRSGLY